MNTSNCIDLSAISFDAVPFPHISSPQGLHHSLELSVFNWFEDSAPWNITIADFYEQNEFDVLKADLPAELRCLVSKETIKNIEQHLKTSFGPDKLELVGVVAHKLVDGQRIGIHNDFINGEETHRLVIHITNNWKEDNGGFLMLFGSSNVNDVSKIVYPLNNFAFGFEISLRSYHAVSKIYNFSRYTLIYTFRDPVVSKISSLAHDFLKTPFPLTDLTLTNLLIQKKWKELNKNYRGADFVYSTALCVNGISDPSVEFNTLQNDLVLLESASAVTLHPFYSEHGLIALGQNALLASGALTKLNDALLLVKMLPGLYEDVVSLVKCIQILKTDDDETDMSYSHPKIPFSIFVSLCNDNSVVSNLRVAESIIHEAMHLKLTLIENERPLVKLNTGNVFFSPWRDEKRPAQGVLHGLFVFRIILAFYEAVTAFFEDENPKTYLLSRRNHIKKELSQLTDFTLCPDLTEDGAILAKNLLPQEKIDNLDHVN